MLSSSMVPFQARQATEHTWHSWSERVNGKLWLSLLICQQPVLISRSLSGCFWLHIVMFCPVAVSIEPFLSGCLLTVTIVWSWRPRHQQIRKMQC